MQMPEGGGGQWRFTSADNQTVGFLPQVKDAVVFHWKTQVRRRRGDSLHRQTVGVMQAGSRTEGQLWSKVLTGTLRGGMMMWWLPGLQVRAAAAAGAVPGAGRELDHDHRHQVAAHRRRRQQGHARPARGTRAPGRARRAKDGGERRVLN